MNVALQLTLRSPDLGRRGMATQFKLGADAGFTNWRSKHLPIHFTTAAIARYGGEYTKHTPRPMRDMNFADRLRRMNPTERRKFYENRRNKSTYQPRQILKNLDPQNRIPLVQTGRMRMLALKGRALHNGPAKRRAIVLTGLPRYVHVNPPNQINKARAIRHFSSGEDKQFNDIVDRHLDGYFKKPTQTRKARIG